MLDESWEDVLWALLNPIKKSETIVSIVVCVRYLPPFTSSRGNNPDTFYDSIIDSLHHYCNLGCVTICGDLNARCGIETDLHEDLVSYIPSRKPIDEHNNCNGDMLLQLLRDCKLCMLNGRSHSDNFTCISLKRQSVVDYCIVQADYFQSISNFTVRTISEFLDNNRIVDAERLPDHSLLSWSLEISVPLCASTIEEKESRKCTY